ncbi:hypothetical protein MSAN_01831600 [Mycena sanguinolenta]|uniref:Uncharacterized protein n=1 Tax=Mycena sanguinolenta TaxID=230812 RepID=A0A8H6XTC9_9AGAR|nr:hypothetical protein MSAN_01831600 [Mycena sanguinolenta]
MASRQTPPELARTASTSDSSPALRTTHAHHYQSSFHAARRTTPSPPSLADPDAANSALLGARHTEPVPLDPSHIEPPATPTVGTGHGAYRTNVNYPSSTQGPSSTPPTVPHPRKRRHIRRNTSSQDPDTAVSDTGNLSEGNERTQRNVDTDWPPKRARKGALLDDRADRNQSRASTRFKRGKNPANAATGSRARASSARPGSNNRQADVNANPRMEFPYVSFTGGTGGAGGSGGNRSGNGGNATGPVFNVNHMNFYIQR